jgi:cytochrome o ubiquinol oxidase subunit 2
MNSFYIPALAGQIYAMPAMQTRLHAVINRPGRYQGFSANYSGAGFSGMRFSFLGMSESDFEGWVAKNKESEARLDRAAYLQLERPSENVAVQRFGATEPRLFDAIRNLCVQPGKMCMSEMMALDAKGGLGLAGLHTTLPLAYDKYSRRGGNQAPFGEEPRFIASICTVEEAKAMMAMAPPDTTPRDLTPIRGLGLTLPAMTPGSMTFAPMTPHRPQTFTELLGLARSSQS